MPFFINMDNGTFQELFKSEINASNVLKTLKETLQDVVEDEDEADECVNRHAECLNILHDIYKSKNADYGNSFHETFKEEGLAMARIRLSDKLNRFKALSKGKEAEVDTESITDTLYDLANYAIMTIMEITDWEDDEEGEDNAENAEN